MPGSAPAGSAEPLQPLALLEPTLILPRHLHQLHDVQQVVQGVGAVPELMLAPEARRHGQEG